MTSPIVDVAELAELLAGRAPTVLDARWELTGPPGRVEFLAGHVPGSQYVDLDRDLADLPGSGGRHPLPDPERFATAMRRAGVEPGRAVVALDGGTGWAAARLWWLLRHHGHDDVRVLDGGWRAWRESGQRVERGEPAVVPSGSFLPRPGRLPVLDVAGAASLARDGVLIDVRTPPRYCGEEEPVDPVAGHIPGARNAPAAAVVDDEGRLRSRDELARHFTAVGATAERPVGAYCGSGVSAAHAVLALEVVGVHAALYPGSWSEWVSDPDRPVATGPEPG